MTIRRWIALHLIRLANWIDPPCLVSFTASEARAFSALSGDEARELMRPKSRYVYNQQSGTWGEIEHALQVHGTLTRSEIDTLLDVRTAGQCLPAMVDAGVVKVIAGSRPYKYRLVESN